MFEFLEKLRQKPENVKKRIAFLTAFSFAGIIFVVWLSIVYPDLKNSNPDKNSSKESEPTPLSALGENISAGFSSISGEFGEIKNMIGGFVQNTSEFVATTSVANTEISSTTTEQ
jgi:hypothetical protein